MEATGFPTLSQKRVFPNDVTRT